MHERRRVDPLRIESVDADWYLRGWCHLRRAVRTFRLDRMSDFTSTTDPITNRPTDVTLPETLFESTPEDLLVEIELPSSALPLILDYIPDGAEQSEDGGMLRTTVRVAHYHGLKRLIAGMSGVAVVTAPEEARQVIAHWAQSALARYGEG